MGLISIPRKQNTPWDVPFAVQLFYVPIIPEICKNVKMFSQKSKKFLNVFTKFVIIFFHTSW